MLSLCLAILGEYMSVGHSQSCRDIFNVVNPCPAMYVAGMRDAVKVAVVEALLRPGRSIRDIRAVRCSEEELERRHGNDPVWHELSEMRTFVADRLELDKDRVLGPRRRNNDFRDAVLDMISNLSSGASLRDLPGIRERVRNHRPGQQSVIRGFTWPGNQSGPARSAS